MLCLYELVVVHPCTSIVYEQLCTVELLTCNITGTVVDAPPRCGQSARHAVVRVICTGMLFVCYPPSRRCCAKRVCSIVPTVALTPSLVWTAATAAIVVTLCVDTATCCGVADRCVGVIPALWTCHVHGVCYYTQEHGRVSRVH